MGEPNSRNEKLASDLTWQSIMYYARFQLQRLVAKSFQVFLSIPSNVAFAISNLEGLEKTWLYPRYQRWMQDHSAQLPLLSPIEQRIVHQLEEHGFCVTSLAELEIDHTSDFLVSAQQLAAQMQKTAQRPEYQGVHTLTASAQQLIQHVDIFAWGASERLLKVVEHYLKLPVAYDGPSVYYSVADGRVAGPRKWHRDREDWRMLKIAVYLSDVDEASGPYQQVKAKANAELVALQPKYKVLTQELEELLLVDAVQNELVSFTGQAGTVIFSDTARYYHRGKPPLQRDRAAIFFSYFSMRPKNPFFCGRSPLSPQDLRVLADTLPEPGRGAVLWRERLPGIGRWVPKNRVKV